MAEFAMSYTRGLLPLFVPLGIGPGLTRISINDGGVLVRMGWAFQATIPASAVAQAELDGSRVTGWGVHGRAGSWLVNGSSRGIVRLDIEPPVSARVIGFAVRLRTLRLSLADPDAFLGALRKQREGAS